MERNMSHACVLFGSFAFVVFIVQQSGEKVWAKKLHFTLPFFLSSFLNR
jgi:hypothetical protein